MEALPKDAPGANAPSREIAEWQKPPEASPLAGQSSAQVFPLVVRDVFATFCYFVIDPSTNHGMAIDPGAQPELLLQTIRENDWTIECILLTHGHFDHMGAAQVLHDALGIPIVAHALAPDYLMNPDINLSARFGRSTTIDGIIACDDGDTIALSSNPNISIEVIYTPGHTNDSCTYYLRRNGIAFVGDTVYDGNAGLTVFPTGDRVALSASIERKILTLPSETLLLSGHDKPLTVQDLSKALG